MTHRPRLWRGTTSRPESPVEPPLDFNAFMPPPSPSASPLATNPNFSRTGYTSFSVPASPDSFSAQQIPSPSKPLQYLPNNNFAPQNTSTRVGPQYQINPLSIPEPLPNSRFVTSSQSQPSSPTRWSRNRYKQQINQQFGSPTNNNTQTVSSQPPGQSLSSNSSRNFAPSAPYSASASNSNRSSPSMKFSTTSSSSSLSTPSSAESDSGSESSNEAASLILGGLCKSPPQKSSKSGPKTPQQYSPAVQSSEPILSVLKRAFYSPKIYKDPSAAKSFPVPTTSFFPTNEPSFPLRDESPPPFGAHWAIGPNGQRYITEMPLENETTTSLQHTNQNVQPLSRSNSRNTASSSLGFSSWKPT